MATIMTDSLKLEPHGSSFVVVEADETTVMGCRIPIMEHVACTSPSLLALHVGVASCCLTG